jgi:hypothetical protein
VSGLVSPEYDLKRFCSHMRGKDFMAVIDAASAEISYARRLHRQTTKTSHFRKGSKGRQYCENLQKLISLLVNGSVPSGSTPDFLNDIKPLILELLQKWKIGNLRQIFSLIQQPGFASWAVELGADPLVIVVSKDEIMRSDIGPALNVLKSLFSAPEIARYYKERVDINFDGYNDDPRELEEIEEVREYVQKLDQQFPFWLFFLSKHMLGLQCIIFCHLLPFLTDAAKAERHPRQLEELLLKRWLPAMNEVGEFIGISDKELLAMTERVMTYVKFGPLKLADSED